MELLQLRYFLESADSENFSKTAEKYMVAPSSVSISVKKLETELGCKLFDRQGNKIRITANGLVLRQALRTALSAIDGAVAAITNSPADDTREIHILVRAERRIITKNLIAFKERYPHVAFHLVHDFNTTDVEKFDIIIDEQSDAYQGFERVPILSENLRFSASVRNPLCGKKLTVSDLVDQPFLTMGENSSVNRLTREVCRKAGFQPNIIIESDDPYYLRKYIELDFGISLIPEISWKDDLSQQITFLDVVDFQQKRVTYAYFNRKKSGLSIAGKFYDFILKQENIQEDPDE